jgi:hypothetical protein
MTATIRDQAVTEAGAIQTIWTIQTNDPNAVQGVVRVDTDFDDTPAQFDAKVKAAAIAWTKQDPADEANLNGGLSNPDSSNRCLVIGGRM